MKKFIRWTRLVRDVVMALAGLLKAVLLLIDLVNKAVNCNYAPEFHSCLSPQK